MTWQGTTFKDLKDGLDLAVQDDDRAYAERLMRKVKQCRMESKITKEQHVGLRMIFNERFRRPIQRTNNPS